MITTDRNYLVSILSTIVSYKGFKSELLKLSKVQDKGILNGGKQLKDLLYND